jgi:phosphatidylglycerophosphate synthase
MLSARFRRYSDLIALPLGGAVAGTGVSPNVLTLAGLLLSVGAAGAFAYGNLVYAFILLALASLFDVLDGAVAKATGKVTKFGGFLDSVADRYSDALILIGIAMYLGEHYVLVMVVIVGSILVSYTRARAENFIVKCDVGLAERSERLIVLMGATLLAVSGVNLFYETLVFLAIITHFTVLQRVLFAKKNI